MPEQLNNPPVPPNERLTRAELDRLSPGKIKELRNQQQKLILDAMLAANADDRNRAHDEALAGLGQHRETFLTDNGIGEDHPQRAEYIQYLSRYSIDNMSDEEWYYGKKSDRTDGLLAREPSGHWRALKEFNDMKDAAPEEQEDNPEARLDELRGAYITTAAARLSAPVFYKNKQRRELTTATEAAQAAYLEQLLAVEGSRLEDMLAAENPDGSRQFTPEQIKQALTSQINDRIRGDETDIKQAMLEQGGWLHRKFAAGLEKYANLSTKKKIAVGIGLAAAATATGFGVGALAGSALAAGIGTAAGTAGVGLAAAGRFGRTYAIRLSRLYKVEDTSAFTVESAENPEDVMDSARTYIEDRLKNRIESADKTKCRAVYWAVGSVAIGSAAGIAFNSFDGDPSLVDKFRGALGWGSDSAPETVPVADGSVYATADAHEVLQPPTAAPPTEVEAPPEVFSDAALSIRDGEGWYETFKDMGIPKENWQELLQEAGPELKEMGMAYEFDPKLGGWGMNMTPDGKMPEEALQYISDLAREHGYLPQLEVEAGDLSLKSPEVDDGGLTKPVPETDNGSVDVPGAEANPMPNRVVPEVGQVMALTDQANFAYSIGTTPDNLWQFMRENGEQLTKLRYSDGTPLAGINYMNMRWQLNAVPEGAELPYDVARRLKGLIEAKLMGLAA